MNTPTSETLPVSRDAILEQLSKILGSPVFQGAERSSALLRYVVERWASGDTARLKEYTLATEALGKSTSFDPRTDPVVRAEASRLRTRLQKYYAEHGVNDPVVITLPKGTYVPQFEVPATPSAALIAPKLGALSRRYASLVMVVLIGLVMLVVSAPWRDLRQHAPISIAVLPLVNLSGSADQEYFSDGITEEITSALAKVPDLTVIGRTSAFQFKGQNKDLRAIGQALNVNYLIQGSLRRAGDRVRITAQLIRADSGVNLWSETYDRNVNDIIATQEDIARSIATSLRVPLGLTSGATLNPNRPRNEETYELYLRGLAALRSRGDDFDPGVFENVVARDSNFAAGWRMLAEAKRIDSLFSRRFGDGSKRLRLLEEAETAARKAIALDPNLAGGYSALGSILAQRGKWDEAMDLYSQGIARNPDDPELLNNYSQTLRTLGFLKKSFAVKDRLALLEPLIPIYARQRAELLAEIGSDDAALKEFQRLIERGVGGQLSHAGIAIIRARQGRFAEAAETLSRSPTLATGDFSQAQLDAAVQVLHAVDKKTNVPSELPGIKSEWGFVYGYTGNPDRVLDWPEEALGNGDYGPLGETLWYAAPPAVRKTDRFQALVSKAGLVAYWRLHGWPDLCHPSGANDFACE
jgi:TolB-like protein